MKLSRSVQPVSHVKAHVSEIIGRMQEPGSGPVIITQNGEARAVLMGIGEYEDMQESLALLKVLALGGRCVEEGRVSPAAAAFSRVRAAKV
ncbi:MAG: type II toxin-antitoxin system Phd/YefM family antitoxin [Humidesulfovibrio sp.]